MGSEQNGVMGADVLHLLNEENKRLASLVTTLHDAKLRLEHDVVALEERVRRHEELQSSLLEQIAQMDANSQAVTARTLEVEQLNSHLANLYVASYRLHGCLDREQLMSTVQEILINLIGTEEFAVFEREPAGDAMRVTSSFGVDTERIPSLRFGEGRLGEVIERGAPYVSAYDPDATSSGRPVTACVPLRVGERVIGAIVVYRLLAHKPGLEDADMQLFNLLSTHGATALYCSDLHARRETGAGT
jgi:hypothetical protein